ncbi:hypothetical protein [Microtetraspora malaysiensis]|uniref:Uncharacterized protein n=1 Tax=Microtetraspora malaysiensis TaxID=161358 RepID=A0ABW6T3B6_9ACTN
MDYVLHELRIGDYIECIKGGLADIFAPIELSEYAQRDIRRPIRAACRCRANHLILRHHHDFRHRHDGDLRHCYDGRASVSREDSGPAPRAFGCLAPGVTVSVHRQGIPLVR